MAKSKKKKTLTIGDFADWQIELLKDPRNLFGRIDLLAAKIAKLENAIITKDEEIKKLISGYTKLRVKQSGNGRK